MSGRQNQSLHRKIAAKQKRVSFSDKKHCLGSVGKIVKQRILVIYSDPDATDCSGDEEDVRSSFLRTDLNGTNRMVMDVCIFNRGGNGGNSASKGGKKPKLDHPNPVGKVGNCSRLRKCSSIYRGVRRRIWGTYGAEIRNPLEWCKRQWMGSFSTELEAHLAHESERLEFERLLKLKRGESNVNALSSQTSPSSVLDVSKANTLGNDPSALIKIEDKEPTVRNVVEEAPNANSQSEVLMPSMDMEPTVRNVVGEAPNANSQSEVLSMPSMDKEPTVRYVVEEAPNANSQSEVPVMPPMEQDVNMGSLLGNSFEHFFDELTIEDLPMCDLSGTGLADLPNFDIEINLEEFSWLDKSLKTAGI